MYIDTDRQIRRWRDTLACRESITTEQLDELQDHLEDELQKIPTQGLSKQERVLIAAQRVGSPDQLNLAFFDADPSLIWRRRILWMIVGLFALGHLPKAIIALLSPLLMWGYSLSIPTAWMNLILLLAYSGVWGGMMYMIWRWMRGAPHHRINRVVSVRPGVAVSVFCLMMLLSLIASRQGLVWHISDNHSLRRITPFLHWRTYTSHGFSVLGPCVLGWIAWRCYRRPSVNTHIE